MHARPGVQDAVGAGREASDHSMSVEASQLERNLQSQLECHDRLLACLQRKREALRRASIDDIRGCCDQERLLLAAVRELEMKRHEMLRRWVGGPVTVADIASRIAHDEPRGRLLDLASELRSRQRALRWHSSIIRAAADNLARHVAGILQSVTGSLASAKVYSSRGRMNIGASTQLTVDLKS